MYRFTVIDVVLSLISYRLIVNAKKYSPRNIRESLSVHIYHLQVQINIVINKTSMINNKNNIQNVTKKNNLYISC